MTVEDRWLDKAAIVDPSFLSPEEHEMQGKLCSVAQVKEIKSLLKMVPMWATFLVYGVVESTGSTFFILQTSILSSPITNSFVDIVIAFNVMKSFTSFSYFHICTSYYFNGGGVMEDKNKVVC